MFLLVDKASDRRTEIEQQLKQRGEVHVADSWPVGKKSLEDQGHSLNYIFLGENVFENPEKMDSELRSLKDAFNGLWVVLSANPLSTLEKNKEFAKHFPIEFWTHDDVLSKLNFIESQEWPTSMSEPALRACLVTRTVHLTDIGCLLEKPWASGMAGFSPEDLQKKEILVLSKDFEAVSDKKLQLFSFVSSGALRDVYQRVQKDPAKQLFFTADTQKTEVLPLVVWVTPEPDATDSLLEFFQKLPIMTLPHLGREDSGADAHQGSKDFFLTARPGEIASLKLDPKNLTVLGVFGSGLNGYQSFLGHSLDAIAGKNFLDLVPSPDRHRFSEMVHSLVSVRPIVNYFELTDASGAHHLSELLVDIHRDGDEEFLLVRVNPFVGELDDHLLRAHKKGLQPPQWPGWVILPVEEWNRVGGAEKVKARLQNSFRKLPDSPDVRFWLISKNPVSPHEILSLLEAGVESVWLTPLPFRLMARQIHHRLGYPLREVQSLQTHLSAFPQILFFEHSIVVEQWRIEGAVLQTKLSLEPGQLVLVEKDKDQQNFGWGRVIQVAGGRAKVSWLIPNPG